MTLPGRRKITRLLVAAAALLGMVPPTLSAQSVGTVRGTVLDAGSQRPVAGAQVAVVGTSRAAVTGADGQYSLAGVPAGTVRLRASLLGYGSSEQAVSVADGQTATADFQLGQSALALDAIVVTGTTGAVARRTIGNSIVQLDAEELTAKTNVSSVAEILQSRTPGVQILSNAGTPGAAADIRVRGAGSLTAVRPIIFVDGIRYNDESLGNFAPAGAGTVSNNSYQATSALGFLNPEDIESIEVIKGPAASTLYGAEAAGGVIQVITKKGARGSQRTTWSAKLEYGQNQFIADVPDNFTTCTAALKAQRTTAGDPIFPGCQGVADNGIIREASAIVRDPFGIRDGNVRRLNLSVRGGGDRFSYFVAGDMDDQEGVFYNSFNDRRSIRANFTAQPAERLDFQVTTNFVRNHLRLPIGDESAQGLLLGSVRGPAGRIPVREDIVPGYVFAVDGARANQYDNQTRSDRSTFGGTANYRPFDWFQNRLTLGIDLTENRATLLTPPGSADAEFAAVPEGQSAIRLPQSRYYTVDYVGNVDLPVTDWLQSTTSFGTQFVSRRTETLFGVGTGLGAPDITTIQNAAVTSGSNSFTENKSLGYYIQEQLAFRDRLFLTGALRADDNSSFGSRFDVIVYPKLSASYVVSEEPALAGFFGRLGADQMKLRAAYGQAGRSPSAYSADQTYTVVKVATGSTTTSGLRTVSFGNPDLEPERGVEWEGGFDVSFLDGRLALDLTQYVKRTDNLLQSQSVAPSTGFIGTRLTNIGEIRNSGTELLVTAIPITRRAFTWESSLNFAANRNRLVRVNDADQQSITATFQAYSSGLQVHRVGYPLASFFASPAIPDSFEVRGANVYPVLDSIQYVGTPTPTREIGFGNTLTLGSFRLFAQLDYKGGHKIFNYKEYDRCRFRTNCERLNDRRYVAPVSAADSAAQAEISLYRGVGVRTGGLITHWEPYIEPGDFLRLRDVSVTYNIPRALLGRTGASNASFTLAAANAAMLWTRYSGMDPEVNTYGNRDFVRVDAYAAPQNRRITASLNVNF